jgi:hypothetical protein
MGNGGQGKPYLSKKCLSYKRHTTSLLIKWLCASTGVEAGVFPISIRKKKEKTFILFL